MTKEEAAEEILKGEKYMDCPTCEENTRKGRRLLNEDCKMCESWSSVRRPGYIEACVVLGLPMPPTHMEMGKDYIGEWAEKYGYADTLETARAQYQASMGQEIIDLYSKATRDAVKDMYELRAADEEG
jgi:hypothetical protein